MNQKQIIFPNLGLAMTPQPDAIQDGQSSDILNLRFDKLGYLTNRNGVRAFNFVEATTPSAPFLTDNVLGATAISEFVLSEPVTDEITFNYDAEHEGKVVVSDHVGSYTQFDRFMVFALRNAGGSLIYYLVPNTPIPDTVQNYRVSITSANNDVVFFVRQEKADGSLGVVCAAPSRRLAQRSDGRWIDEATGEVDDLNWIDHYQDIVQYNQSLVICDRTNGDALIRDSWDDAETGQEKVHHLRFQENAKVFFDVDTVRVDPRLASGEENYEGIEHGMALYQFYLPKRDAWYTQDNYKPGFYDDKVGQDLTAPGEHIAVGFRNSDLNSAMLNGYNAYADVNGQNQGGTSKFLFKNTISQSYSFSDYNERTRFDSLLDPVQFHDPNIPEVYDDKGNLINNDAADVFIWEDMRIKYYPSSGKVVGQPYLRGEDREFAKTTSVEAKTVKLKTRTGLEQKIPLGVWAYQFVWDMGNGEYSAPSSNLLVPDKLWSATRDGSSNRIQKFDNNETYTHDYEHTTYSGINSASGVAGTSLLLEPSVYSSPGFLSPYGDIFQQIKNKLYASDHVFGGSAASTELQTLVTVHHHASEISLTGTFLSAMNFHIYDDGDTGHIQIDTHHRARLIIPLTQTVDKKYTYNSIFSDLRDTSGNVGGYYRKAIQDFSGSHQHLFREFVFEGANTPYCKQLVNNSDASTFDFDLIRYKRDVYYNLVCHHDDENNNPAAIQRAKRIASTLRFVQRESDRLLLYIATTPQEVVNRLIAQGIAEFRLSDYTDAHYCRAEHWGAPEYNNSPDPNAENHLDYDKDRTIETTAHTTNGMMVVPDITFKEYSNPSSPTTLAEALTLFDLDAANDTWYGDNLNYPFISANSTTDQDWVTEQDPSYAWGNPDNPNRWFRVDNCRVAFHLPGERLLLPEQLSAYFPSSLLFGSPRIMLKIDPADIPTRARRLMIFRTKASHRNDWQPDSFGLVDTVTVSGTALHYFDEVKDTDLDFTYNPLNYEGLTHPLKSRFCLPLNERMYYGRFEETYQPIAPRGFVVNDYQTNIVSGYEVYAPYTESHPNALKPTDTADYSYVAGWKELTAADTMGNRNLGYSDWFQGKTLTYFTIFKDKIGEYSDLKNWPGIGPNTIHPEPSHFVNVDFSALASGTLGAVAFYCESYPFNGILDTLEIYRTENDQDYYKIGEIKREDEGVFVDTGLPNLSKWDKFSPTTLNQPVSPPKVEDYISSVRWSEIYDPSFIKLENVESFLIGNGDGITGMSIIDGSLLVFKERSVIRAMTGGGTEITRRDIVSNQYGCIAPETIVNYNEHVYFLSWFGLMKYDNTGLVKADGDFGYELEKRFRYTNDGFRDPAIRDATAALNPVYKELYLNIPTVSGTTYDVENEGIKGHIYVINLETNLSTKFAYETGEEIFHKGETTNDTLGTWPRTQGRLYYANSYGQFWSADQLPRTQEVTSYVYIEAPTNLHEDDFQRGINADGTQTDVSQIVRGLIQTWWRSKKFKMADTSNLKRVWKVFTDVTKGESIRITMETANAEYLDNMRSGGAFGTTGKLEYVPPFEPGADRGEGITFELASKGETEIQSMAIIWKVPNSYYR